MDQMTDRAVEMIRTGGQTFEKEVYNSSVVKWLPMLELEAPHPLDPSSSEKMRLAEEVYQFFKDTYPDKPYDSFLDHVGKLVPISSSETRISQVLRSIRLLKMARKTINELNSLGLNP